MRRIFAFLILMSGLAFMGRLWYTAKDGFNINRVQFVLEEKGAQDKAFSPNPLSEHAPPQEIAPRYRYLGRGRQCYAFCSEDDRMVLKIPRFDRYFLPLRWKGVPDGSCQKQEISQDRKSRLFFTLESFRIAAEELKEQTRVVYLHLHRTRSLPKKTILTDQMGRSFEVDLNQMAFMLQEKKPLMMPQFLEALKRGDSESAKKVLSAFLDVVEARAKRGLFNKDPSFLKNFALAEGVGIQIDIGSFYRKEGLIGKEAYERSMREGVGPLCGWLKEVDPALSQWFGELFDEKLQCGLSAY